MVKVNRLTPVRVFTGAGAVKADDSLPRLNGGGDPVAFGAFLVPNPTARADGKDGMNDAAKLPVIVEDEARTGDGCFNPFEHDAVSQRAKAASAGKTKLFEEGDHFPLVDFSISI